MNVALNFQQQISIVMGSMFHDCELLVEKYFFTNQSNQEYTEFSDVSYLTYNRVSPISIWHASISVKHEREHYFACAS